MSREISITYHLSEEGRKKSLLLGGDGKKEQVIEADLSPELLSRAYVREDGNAVWSVLYAPQKYLVLGGGTRKPYVTPGGGATYHYFDQPQTAESLLAWVEEREALATAEKAALEAELPALVAAWEADQAAKKEKEAAKEAAEKAAEAAEKAAKAARDAERSAWIAEHGSDYLRRATALGYNCQRQYMTERAAAELPGFDVDFDRRAEWQNRSCPSVEALELVEALIEGGHNAEVVWLVEPVAQLEDEDGCPAWFDPCEAVVVQEYLGKYYLVKIL